jgi:UDPglucose 6-dehydrogenase
MREAPAIEIINGLTDDGAACHVYDPKASENATKIFSGNAAVLFGRNQYEVLEGAEGLILLTEWLSFREPDFERMKSLMKTHVIFDGRNQYNPKLLAERGFHYLCIGRPNV